MKTDQRMIDALNDQIHHEITNFYVYRNLAGTADNMSLLGMKDWLHRRAMEELDHFEAFYNHLSDRCCAPSLTEIGSQANIRPKSALEIFELALKTEEGTTEKLKSLHNLSLVLKDGVAEEIILKFLKEQIEEEKTITDIINRLKLAGEGLGVLQVDMWLSEN